MVPVHTYSISQENLQNALKVLQLSHYVHLKFASYLVGFGLKGKIRNDLKSRIQI